MKFIVYISSPDANYQLNFKIIKSDDNFSLYFEFSKGKYFRVSTFDSITSVVSYFKQVVGCDLIIVE